MPFQMMNPDGRQVPCHCQRIGDARTHQQRPGETGTLRERDSVDIRYFSIIYEVADDVEKLVKGKVAPKAREKFLGYAEVRKVFNITKTGKVAGCMVTEGTVKRGAKVRLLRDNVVIHEGSLGQLKRFKDDVKEVRESYECGMSFDNYNDIQVGDIIECFEIEEVAGIL